MMKKEILLIFITSLTSIFVIDPSWGAASTPRNQAVVAGQRMEMRCQAENDSNVMMLWFFVPVSSNTPKAIATYTTKGLNLVGNFSVVVDRNGSCVLSSNLTKLEDAGSYSCELANGSKIEKHVAQLIVFESGPICETNISINTSLTELGYIRMQCRVRFRGNWAPTFEWKEHDAEKLTGEGRRIIDNETELTIIPDKVVTYISTLTTKSTRNASFFYSCRVYFTRYSGLDVSSTAIEVPDFDYIWTSPLIVVSTISTVTYFPFDPSQQTDSTKTLSSSEFLFIVLGVVIGVCFFLTVLIVTTCYIFIRKSTSAWMANFVSSYEKTAPRFVQTIRRATDRNRTDEVAPSSTNVRLEEIPQTDTTCYEGYSEADDIGKDSRQIATVVFPNSSSAASDERPENVELSCIYRSDENRESLLYATIRKNIEPPKCSSIYSQVHSDSDD